MVQLRPYQLTFIEAIRSSLVQHRRIIACAATGSGKSKVFISIAQSAVLRNRAVLVLTESTRIYEQLAAELAVAHEINPDAARWIHVQRGHIYVAMAQTLARRSAMVTQFASLGEGLLIINDEAHIGTATSLIEAMPDALLIGFTATPDYRVAKHLPKLYQDCVVGAQPQELVEEGFLSPYRHFSREGADMKALKKVRGEFSEQSQRAAFDRPEVVAGILDDIRAATFRKGMIFCSSIAHAEHLHQQLPGSVVYHSLRADAARQLAEFTHGSARICVSVGALTKGFDFPGIDAIFLNRATTSLPLYLQMIGRGSRVVAGKSTFTVYDYGGNAGRFGLWNADRDWASMWSGRNKRTLGIAPTRTCKNCGYIAPVSVTICPNCGAAFPVAASPISDKATTLINLTADYEPLRGRRISTLTPEELTTYQRMTKRNAFCKRIAMSRGEEYLFQYATLQGWKRGWNRYINAAPGMPFADITIR
jgi:superfamily II DNA or RNA helicase